MTDRVCGFLLYELTLQSGEIASQGAGCARILLYPGQELPGQTQRCVWVPDLTHLLQVFDPFSEKIL